MQNKGTVALSYRGGFSDNGTCVLAGGVVDVFKIIQGTTALLSFFGEGQNCKTNVMETRNKIHELCLTMQKNRHLVEGGHFPIHLGLFFERWGDLALLFDCNHLLTSPLTLRHFWDSELWGGGTGNLVMFY
jgi:hypothetical protein